MSDVSPASDNLLIVEDDEGLRRQYRWLFPELRLSLAGTREEGPEDQPALRVWRRSDGGVWKGIAVCWGTGYVVSQSGDGHV